MSAAEILPPCDSDAIQIGDLYRKGKSSMVDSVRYLVEAGQRLVAKKDSLRHGEWLPWLEANADALGFGERTARLLMGGANRKLTADFFDFACACGVFGAVFEAKYLTSLDLNGGNLIPRPPPTSPS